MAFDGITNYAIVSELNSVLIGGKVNKIYQPTKNKLVLAIYANSKKYNLLICIQANTCRIHCTQELETNPSTPYSFCMLLRKHLIGAKIKRIATNGLDRIDTIEFETYNEMNDLITKKLIIELMGKHSNVILTNEKNIILDSMRHISSSTSDRTILPANPYIPPTTIKKDFLKVDEKTFFSVVENTTSLKDCLSNEFLGFSKQTITNLLEQIHINNNKFTKENIQELYISLKTLIKNIDNLMVDCVHYSLDQKDEYTIISSENRSILNVNTFIDKFYTQKEKSENFESVRNNVFKIILGLLQKYTKRLNNIDKKLEECKKMNLYQLYGELLTSNLYKLKNSQNLSTVVLENYYDANQEISIPLDNRYSPSVNAKLYFKKYNKLKNALKIVTIQKEETKAELNYIESIIYALSYATSIQEINEIYLEIKENLLKQTISSNKKKKEDTSSPLQLSIQNHIVYVGKNNKQNDELTFKIASKEDLWFHAKDIHGSHVVLKMDHDVSKELIKQCASIAAYYSKAKSSSKVEVQYTKIKNIKKPRNSKPGFVVFSKYQSIVVPPNIDFI